MSEEKSPIQKLNEMQLPEFPAIVFKGLNGWTEYSETPNENRGRGLLKEAGISIAQWFNKRGYQFPEHAHQQQEWIIIQEGCMRIHIKEHDGKDRVEVLQRGDFIHIPRNVVHRAEFPECDCYYIAIVMPGAPEWPT